MQSIYEIGNRETGETYLGSSGKMLSRWTHHVNALHAGKHPNALLQAAWQQYGPTAFTFRAFEIVDGETDQYAREMELIGQLNPAYNIAGTPKVEQILSATTRRRHLASRRNSHPMGHQLHQNVTLDLDARSIGLFQCPNCGEPCLLQHTGESYHLEHASEDRIWGRIMAFYLVGHFDHLVYAALNAHAAPGKVAGSDTSPDTAPEEPWVTSGNLHFRVRLPGPLPVEERPDVIDHSSKG